MCGTCQHDVNRFSAISAHRCSSRFVKGQLSRESADFTGRVNDIMLMEMLGLKFSLQNRILCIVQGEVGVTSNNLLVMESFKRILARWSSDTWHIPEKFHPKFFLHFVAPKIKEDYINSDLIAVIKESKIEKLSSHSHPVYIPSQHLTDTWVQASPSKFCLCINALILIINFNWCQYKLLTVILTNASNGASQLSTHCKKEDNCHRCRAAISSQCQGAIKYFVKQAMTNYFEPCQHEANMTFSEIITALFYVVGRGIWTTLWCQGFSITEDTEVWALRWGV